MHCTIVLPFCLLNKRVTPHKHTQHTHTHTAHTAHTHNTHIYIHTHTHSTHSTQQMVGTLLFRRGQRINLLYHIKHRFLAAPKVHHPFVILTTRSPAVHVDVCTGPRLLQRRRVWLIDTLPTLARGIVIGFNIRKLGRRRGCVSLVMRMRKSTSFIHICIRKKILSCRVKSK